MEIKLAGYNVESEILDQITAQDNSIPRLTPETISAAYARISRSSKEIKELRKEAREDVQKARQSNQRIIFEMSHHSVAEHAVFNFDIIGVSRLALEEIEKFRLVSYTEKSQRYVTLDGDFTIPEEIPSNDSHYRSLFINTVEIQNQFYKKAFLKLKEYLFDQYPQKIANKSEKKVVEGWAKEDARYILSLATQGQVGVTINARNLEHLFRRFTLSSRAEVREIGKLLFQRVEKITPSLILFPTPSRFVASLSESFTKKLNTFYSQKNKDQESTPIPLEPQILSYTQNADDIILASLFAFSNQIHYSQALDFVGSLNFEEKKSLYIELFRFMEFFDAPPRDFEFPQITFQAVISASNFAQLKRHRIATLISGDYDTAFGNIIPPNIKIIGMEDEFNHIITETNAVYRQIKEKYPQVADYILTNSHCRRVIMKMNLREMYHFIRLRADAHAQWDIRNLASNLLEKTREIMPLSTLLLSGKSQFVEQFEQIYNQKPNFLI